MRWQEHSAFSRANQPLSVDCCASTTITTSSDCPYLLLHACFLQLHWPSICREQDRHSRQLLGCRIRGLGCSSGRFRPPAAATTSASSRGVRPVLPPPTSVLPAAAPIPTQCCSVQRQRMPSGMWWLSMLQPARQVQLA